MKEVLTLSQTVASVIAVPFLSEAIKVALKIIQVCEVRMDSTFKDCKTIDQIFHQEASDVEEKVKELQVRVGDLLVIIVNHVTLNLNEEDTKETFVKTFGQDIEELLRCGLQMGSLTASDDMLYSVLKSINKHLEKISAQNRWVIAVYKQLNMNAIEKCMNRLSTAMQKFTVCIWRNVALS